MKILLVGPAYPFRGGLAAFNERLARELAREHEVTIYTFTLQYPNFLFPGKTQFAEGPAPEGLRIERVVSSVNPLTWFSAAKRANAEGFDLAVIGFWLPFMGPALGTIARRLKCPVVSVVHNIIPHEPRPGDVSFARYYAGGSDGFISLTDSVREDLVRFVGDKPSVVSPHPVYDHFGAREPAVAARAKLGLDPDANYLLFFGLIREYKGLDILLQALADPRLAALDLRLIVAGEFYTGRALYDTLINSLRLQDRVDVRDEFIPDDAVADYFNACDLLVQPYKTATQSGVTQIAYHFELPMVVTDVGGLAEMCPDGKVGYVAQPDPTAIATAILRFFTDTDRAAMRAGVADERARYDWSIMAERILNLLPKK